METLKYPTKVEAKKEHRCDFCLEKIERGEVYLKSTHKYDGKVYDFKTHFHCAEIASRLNMYDEADEGVTGEMFQETINCVYSDLMYDQLPKDEPHKYRDIISQLHQVRFKAKLAYVIRYYSKLDSKI